MATRGAKATMDAEATKRLNAASTALAVHFGIDLPDAPAWVRDPEYRAIQERERLATILERLVVAVAEQGVDTDGEQREQGPEGRAVGSRRSASTRPSGGRANRPNQVRASAGASAVAGR